MLAMNYGETRPYARPHPRRVCIGLSSVPSMNRACIKSHNRGRRPVVTSGTQSGAVRRNCEPILSRWQWNCRSTLSSCRESAASLSAARRLPPQRPASTLASARTLHPGLMVLSAARYQRGGGRPAPSARRGGDRSVGCRGRRADAARRTGGGGVTAARRPSAGRRPVAVLVCCHRRQRDDEGTPAGLAGSTAASRRNAAAACEAPAAPLPWESHQKAALCAQPPISQCWLASSRPLIAV